MVHSFRGFSPWILGPSALGLWYTGQGGRRLWHRKPVQFIAAKKQRDSDKERKKQGGSHYLLQGSMIKLLYTKVHFLKTPAFPNNAIA